MDYYDDKFAFFPDQLNRSSPQRRKYYYIYLVSESTTEMASYTQIAGNPDSIPTSLYTLEGPFGKEMKLRRKDAPDVIYSGKIFKIHLS